MTGMRTPEEIAKEIYNVHTLVYLSYEERLQKTIYLLRQYAEQENSLRESSSPVESDAVKINVLEKQNQQHREALEMIANEISDGEESTFHFLRRLRIIASQALK